MANIDKNTHVDPVIDGSGPDGTFQELDDLKEEVLETFADFLFCLTSDGQNGNRFRLSPGLEKVSTHDSNGDPAALDLNAKGSENPFAPASQNPSLVRHSDSGQIFQPSIGSFLTKGKSDTILKDVAGLTDTSGKSQPSPVPVAQILSGQSGPIIEAIDTALDNNRFSPGPRGAYAGSNNIQTLNPAIGKLEDRTSKEVRTVARTQSDFGRHRTDGMDIEMEDLKKIAESLALRSAREIKAAQTGDPRSAAVGAAALIPGASQIALLKVDTNEVQASRVMEENFNYPPKPHSEIESITNQGNKSWGQLNTQLEPYGGFLPIGMTGLAVVLTVGIRLIVSGLLGFLGLIVKEKGFHIPHRGPFPIGQYGKPSTPGALFSLKMIGIQDTEQDFLSAVSEGVDVFFAFDGTNFKRVVREPQFYVIFVRNIVRSANTIVNEIRDVFSSNQNPLAAAQAFIGLIDILKSSKVIAFLNIMAQLGDRSLAKQSLGFSAGAKRVSQIENLAINPATNVMRIRNRRSGLRSGMNQDASLSKFLFPSEILKAAEMLGNSGIKKGLAGMPENHVASNEKDITENGRIKSEIVEKVETSLDSEYVPFYFHDLRTNEIISFHAFLSNLEDNYSPQYESTQAYGRIDNVRTYASTERTITLSFNIVATNKESFDLMWWKINKITSMVYPSWTEGRAIESGDGKFIQPFSQLPASTPLIRLRVGDIIRSNYSKFALQRLFGVGTDKFNLIDDSLVKSESFLSAEAGFIANTRDRMLRNPAITGDPMDGYLAKKAILLPNVIGYPAAPTALGAAKRAAALLLGKANIKKRLIITTSTKVKVSPAIGSPTKKNPKATNVGGYGEHGIAYYTVEVDDDGGGVPDEMKGSFIVTHDDLVPDPETVLDLSTVPSPPTTPNPSKPSPFSSGENAIVRSFESVKGKGLGGVITGLTYTELASPQIVWETSDFGSRAPKMIKVNMTFAVIHDIAPGIDHKGFMRAIQYPVGRIAHTINGDTYDSSEERNSESTFNKNHRDASRTLRNENKKGD